MPKLLVAERNHWVHAHGSPRGNIRGKRRNGGKSNRDAYVVRSPLSVASVAATLRHDVAKIDKDLPVSEIASMPDALNASVAQPRFRTFLLGLFAAMALVLAATGIFGVISYSVARRTHEIGIRVALGASRGAILGLVSRETLMLISAGLILGGICALAASLVLSHLLFGVSASDPLTLDYCGRIRRLRERDVHHWFRSVA